MIDGLFRIKRQETLVAAKKRGVNQDKTARNALSQQKKRVVNQKKRQNLVNRRFSWLTGRFMGLLHITEMLQLDKILQLEQERVYTRRFSDGERVFITSTKDTQLAEQVTTDSLRSSLTDGLRFHLCWAEQAYLPWPRQSLWGLCLSLWPSICLRRPIYYMCLKGCPS